MSALVRALRSAVLRAPGGDPAEAAVAAPAEASAERWGRVAVGAALVLCALGVLMVYSSSSVRAARDAGDGTLYLKRQLAWAGIGLGAMVVCMRVPLSFWRTNARPLLVLSLALLAAVLVVGTEINGGRRWFRLGSFSFQPSELAKVSCLVFVSAWLCDRRDSLHEFRRGFLPAAAAVGGMAVLILVEPDFGTALFVGSLGTALLIVGGARMKHLLALAACSLPVLAWSVWTRLETIQERFQFMGGADQAHYQVRQGLVALGSGGLLGRGPGAGTAKLFFLPEASSDFILPMLGEELGFAGTLLVILLYAAFVRAGARVCLRCIDRDPFAFLLSLGATLWVGLQACINIAVTTACAPTKGIALPFVSLGGSGLVTLMAATGILYAAARRADDAALALEGRVS
ncbi:MAG: FtsW/RodA/SpoVE family cell cycle protein [Planctomycetaceae bacterium]|nr:FtsW/RodA/SpoVE family cell cycle protein [Planctomycetaceae bacterium]